MTLTGEDARAVWDEIVDLRTVLNDPDYLERVRLGAQILLEKYTNCTVSYNPYYSSFKIIYDESSEPDERDVDLSFLDELI